MGDLPLRTPRYRRLGGPLPHQLPNITHAHPLPNFFHHTGMPQYDVCGISRNFSRLFPCKGQVAYALLTRAPVAASGIATTAMPLDLHVLSLSLAFILSQDQTLRCCYIVFFFSCLLSDLETASTPADGLTEGFRPLPSSCLIIALCQCSLLFFAPGFDRKASAKLRRVFHSCKFFRNFFQKNFFRNLRKSRSGPCPRNPAARGRTV